MAARRLYVPALLSLLWIGLGDAYNGRPARGARLLAATLLATLVLATLWGDLTAAFTVPWLHVLLLGYVAVPFACRIFGAARAWRDARQLADSPRPPHLLRTCVIYLLCAEAATLVIAMAVRTGDLQAFKIPSGAMVPTLRSAITSW